MATNLRLQGSPLSGRNHLGLETLADHLFAVRTLVSSFLGPFRKNLPAFVDRLRPNDIRPHDLVENATFRAGNLENALIGFFIGSDDSTRILEDRRRSDDDLAIRE